MNRLSKCWISLVFWAWALGLGPVLAAGSDRTTPLLATNGPRYEVMPLVERGVADPGSTPGFTLIPPALSGITFSNGLAESLMMANNNLMNGSGVAAGDIDGDGRPDLYFCAINGTNVLYRNLGNWRFEDITASAGVGLPGSTSTGALLADIDGDGDLDLLVSSLGRGVRVLSNDGQGRFREVTAEAGVSAPTGSMSLAMGDVDGDGDLDLYVANYGTLSLLRSGGQTEMRRVDGQWVVVGPHADRLRFVDGRLEEVGEPDALYLNDGRGRFQAVPWGADHFLDEEGQPRLAPWDFGLSVQIRDINGDRRPDIYVCNDFQTVDRIWINQGEGRFRALPRLAMRKQSFSAMGVDFGDLDRDGHLDFFVTEMMSREHAVRMRQVVGMAPPAVGPGLIEQRPTSPRNTLFRSWGDGEYAELANYAGVPASDWSWQPLFLDVDLDGYEDILVGNGMAHDVQDRDVLNRIRALGRQTPLQSRTNLLLYPPFLTPNVAWRNRGDFTFEDVSESWGFAATEISQGMAMADLDGDGDLDLAINTLNAQPLLYRNNTTAPRIAVRLAGRPPNRAGIGSVVRLLGGPVPHQEQEILAGGHYLSGSEALRVFAAGDAPGPLTLEVRWLGGQTSTIPQVEPNRLYVIHEPTTQESAVAAPGLAAAEPWFEDVSNLLGHRHHEIQYDDYARQPLLMRQLSQLGPSVGWLDLDGDGQDELLVGAGRGGSLGVYRRLASGRFERVPAPAVTLPDDLGGLAAWFDAEGRPGLIAALANYESGQSNAFAYAYSLDAATRSRVVVRPLPGSLPRSSSPGAVAVGDIDGDHFLDVLVLGRVIGGQYPLAAGALLFRHGPTGLTYDLPNSAVLEHVGLVSAAVWSDLDQDGYPELILACEWGPIRVFRNVKGRLIEATQSLGLAGLTGWWNGVTTADVDGDGLPDIVATNWGLNTGYEADPDRPERLYYGDPYQRGALDLLEAYTPPELGDRLVPRRNLHALSQAFPVLLQHYSSHAAFGQASIQDLLQIVSLPTPPLSAATLATTVFLNRGDKFLPVPLPPEAQWSPAFGIVVADFDGDGHEDVFLSQNFFANRPEWPRADGGRGLWLRGQGDGTFSAVSGMESGILVHGEQRGAAAGDFDQDGRMDLVVTQNGAETRLFRNRAGRPGLRVRIAGPTANPAGIGCSLRLRFGQRWGPVREIHAGSGYWSQNSLVTVLATPEPPSAIQVLWPGGLRMIHDVPTGTKEITLTHPSRRPPSR